MLFIKQKNSEIEWKEDKIQVDDQSRKARSLLPLESSKRKGEKTPFRTIIGEAIASVKESDLGDLEQRIHFFQLVKDNSAIKNFVENILLQDQKFNLSNNQTKKKNNLKNQDKRKNETDLTLSDLEASDLEDNVVISVKYGLGEEERLAQEFYKSGAIDYIKMFYGDTGKIPPVFAQLADIYAETGSKSDVITETMQTEEATATFMEIQYATMAGAQSSISFKDRNRLDTWIKFNKDLFGMLQHSVALTQEIDYSRVG